MTLRDRITEEITIKSASLEGDRWKITADIPSMHSQHDIGPIWKPYEEGEQMPTKTRVRVTLARGKLKKIGSYEDRDYGHYWELVPGGWNTTAELTPLPTAPTFSTNGGGGSSRPDWEVQKDLRIAWNSSINNSVHLHGPCAPGEAPGYAWIHTNAKEIYNMIVAGPPQEGAEPAYPDATEMGSDAPEMAVEAVSPSQPQTTTAPPTTRPQRPPPKCSDAKWKQLNQARYDKDGTEVYSGDDVVNHIATNYAERGPRDLVDAEIDAVIEALIAGQIKAAKVANDTAIF
jgi:hypothetical protein